MKSISSKLTLWYAFVVTFTAAVFMLFGRFLIERSYIEGIDQLNDKEFEEISPRIEALAATGDEEGILEAIRKHSELDAALFFFQMGYTHDRILFTSSNMGGHQLPGAVHNKRRITVTDPELGPMRSGEYEVGGFDVNIASSLSGLEGLLANLNRLGMISLAGIFMLSLFVGRFLSRIALRPVAKMQQAATRISAHNLSERIDVVDTGDEIGLLGRLLNTMFDRLERSFDEVQRFTADASHELKTPLSLIRLSSEKLREKLGDTDKENAQLLDNQMDMVDRLNKVVNDLLVLAKADAGSLKLSLRRLSISDFVREFSQDAEALCEDSGLVFKFRNECEGWVQGDTIWLHHVLFNLISNAIRFSPPGGEIQLLSECNQGNWQLSLQDEGPGIPEDKLELVFKRFYNETDPSGGKGSGLGLPLCLSIARLHNGNLELTNRIDSTGITAMMILPMSKDA